MTSSAVPTVEGALDDCHNCGGVDTHEDWCHLQGGGRFGYVIEISNKKKEMGQNG